MYNNLYRQGSQYGSRDWDVGNTTYLTIYGTIDMRRQANAAQVRYKPLPTETTIPIGVGFPANPMTISLTDSAFLMMTVHIAAPMRINKLPIMAKVVEAKNVKLFFAIPLETCG